MIAFEIIRHNLANAIRRPTATSTSKIDMAVSGLGCPVHFIPTAGSAGDCPQAYPPIEGLPARVVMADVAYDADLLRKVIAGKRRAGERERRQRSC